MTGSFSLLKRRDTHRVQKNRSRFQKRKLLVSQLEDRVTPTTNLGFEVEPNNTPATATVGNSDFRVKGHTLTSGDLDYYSFTAVAGDRVYAATMTSGSASSFDSFVTIFASDGTTVLESDNDDGSLGSTSSSIAGVTIPANGTYYVQVKGGTGATAQLRPYDLYLTVRNGAPVAESEPNDVTPQALPGSGWVAGDTSSATDVDLYNVTLSAGDTIFVSLDLDPERDATTWNGRVGLGLFGNPQFFLVSSDASVTSPNSEAMFFTVKDAGTYQILVDTQATVTFGTYHLSASIMPASAATKSTYTDSPALAINDLGITTTTINIPDSKEIGNLRIAIDLTHTNMPDLDIELTSPSGNTVLLFNDVGVNTQPDLNVVLDDNAAFPMGLFTITSGMVARPEAAYRLEWFKGENAQGTWTLTIRDDTTANTGTLNSWSIIVEDPPALPPGMQTAVFSADFEANDGGFTHSGTQDEWEWGVPTAAPVGFAPINTAFSGTNVWATDLDDTYNASSNQDLFSPNINLTSVPGGTDIMFNWAMKYTIESASFDRLFVEVQEVGGSGLVRRYFEWTGASMNGSVGSPSTTVSQSAGWGKYRVAINEFAGKIIRLRFHLESDSSINYTGVAIDDVSVIRFGSLDIPSASASASNVTVAGVAPQLHQIKVIYTDDVLIDGTSIKTGNIRVTGPGGFSVIPTLDAPVASGMSVTAFYSFTAADNLVADAWDDSDNGVYVVETLASDPVMDNDGTPGTPVPTLPNIGQFSVGIPKSYVVGNTSDIDDASLPTDPISQISIREAIRFANTDSIDSKISFDPTAFASATTIMLASSLTITEAVTITGTGSNKLTLDATGSSDRVLTINATGTFAVVNISGMTMTGGSTTTDGGGITMGDDDVTLTDVVVTGNSTTLEGGGINVSTASGKLTLVNSVVSSNNATTAGNDGGGINFDVSASSDSSLVLTLIRSTVSGNSAGDDGGGIYFFLGGTCNIIDSTVSGNTAVGDDGGGAYLWSVATTVQNSTISGNTATDSGGGIALLSTDVINIDNSTLAFNSAANGGNLSIGAGWTVNVKSSIISDGTATTSGPDIKGVVTTATYTLVEDITDATVPADPTNITLMDPMLGALNFNGGLTKTHRFTSSASPAIDKGINSLPLSNDQRGTGNLRTFDRPDGTWPNAADGTDMGALEYQPPVINSYVYNDGDPQRSRVTKVEVSFSQAVTLTAPAFTMNRYGTGSDTPFGDVAIDVTPVGGAGTNFLITFKAGGTVGVDPGNSLMDGQYTLSAVPANVTGDEVMTAPAVSKVHRLFGDTTFDPPNLGPGADGAVQSNDFSNFRRVFGTAASSSALAFALDYDADGQVDSDDFAALRRRFGLGGYLP